MSKYLSILKHFIIILLMLFLCASCGQATTPSSTTEETTEVKESKNLTREDFGSLKTQNGIFFGTYHSEPKIGNATFLTYQTENQTKSNNDERLYPLDQSDELLNSFLPNSALKTLVPEVYMCVLSISPNQKYLFLTSQIILAIDNKKPKIDSGRKLQAVSVTFYFIHDKETNTDHLVGKIYKKYYSPIPKEISLRKEVGSYCYPVFWGEDELLVIQVKKGEEFVRGSDIEKYPQLASMNYKELKQSLDATPKCMSISLKDFSIRESTKVKPITPWVCWADQYKGIISWMSPNEPRSSMYAELPDPETGTQYPHFVSDLSGDHVWNLKTQAKLVLPKEEKFEEALLICATYWKGKKAVLLDVYSDKKSRICILDIETGFVDVLTGNGKDLDLGFGFSYQMLYGSPSNPNQEPIALLNVSPRSINPIIGGPPYKKDVNGLYVAQITKDNIKLLWKVDPEPYRTRRQNPFFITEVVK